MASTSSMPAYLMPGVPVHQPAHLEGDPTLATEILPGPPSLLSIQQSTQKRDPRKPSIAYSYLHPTDPGTSYSGIVHGTIIGQEDASGALRGKRSPLTGCPLFLLVPLVHSDTRASSLDSTVTGRAQRASARNHNGAAPPPDLPRGEPAAEPSLSQPISVNADPMILDDEASISRSNSAPNLPEGSAATEPAKRGKGRPKGKAKAKAKEVEAPAAAARIKEEPKAVSLEAPSEPSASNQIINEDHCSSCRSHGALVYCDGCPRAFHLWCLNPPMENIDEGDSRWFCPACVIRKHPPRKPPPSLFSPLIHLVQTTIPTEFQLPDEVRTFFKDVGTGPKGNYVDNSVVRQPRLNRFGLIEDRDAFRLRDKNGEPVLCFKCGTSALPTGLAATAPAAKRARRSSTRTTSSDTSKSIVSCDYCSLHWHLDCLDPPLPTMPVINKKWMCPNHAERVLLPKLRIPKQAAPIEISKPNQFNNGIIEIIHPQTASTSQVKKVTVDEVLINGRRYRVPERIVVLDFWNKVSKNTPTDKESELPASGMSSPLTSLSSLDDSDERIPATGTSPEAYPGTSPETEDLRVAQMLCNFQLSRREHGDEWSSTEPRKTVESSTQTDDLVSVPASKQARATPLKRTAGKAALTNGQSHTLVHATDTADAGPSTSTAKRKRTANGAKPTTPLSTRELRPRNSRQLGSVVSISSQDSGGSSGYDPFLSTPSKSKVRIKQEEHENGMAALGGSPVASSSKTTAKGRQVRRPSQKDSDDPPKRGRKRKEREDDLSDENDKDRAEAVEQLKKSRTEKEARENAAKGKEKERKKVEAPTRSVKAPSAASPSTNGAPPAAPGPVGTPSLKIRLPRLSDLHTSSPQAAKSMPLDNSTHV
ncbi:hypothetical protein C8J57DRAFT_1506889 [Mycena rebaudengoi]|nr:hypothetical protein C8J57DRAFT_1506889 [Mycena rebaudengoi]